MNHSRITGIVLGLGLACRVSAEDDVNWPEFRGPRGDGTSTSTGLPITWTETEHIKWKTPIEGKAWSSPVIWGKQIWLSSATPDGHELFALCLDRDTGKIVRNQKLFDVPAPQFAHAFNSHASPTPAIQEGRVYMVFGATGIACLDTADGRVIWERRDFVCNHFRGSGSSPILHEGRLYLNFDGSDHQFLVALDQKTGQTLWRTERSIDFKDLTPEGKVQADGDFRKAFTTCRVGVFDGVPQLISQGGQAMYGYDPATGKEYWRVEERTSQGAGTRPAIGDGLVYIPSGWAQGQILAIRPGKNGEVLDANANSEPTATPQKLSIVWKVKKNVPKKPSLTYNQGLLFGIDDNGVANCWDAATGTVVWSERIGGNYSAAPLLAEGHLYFCSEEGKITVVKAGRQFEKLGESKLSGGFMASPAVSGKSLYLRTKTDLYRIEN